MSSSSKAEADATNKQPLPALPSQKDVMSCIPAECFERSLPISFMYAVRSSALTIGTAYLALSFLPTPSLTFTSLHLWFIYALVNGTIATGVWVVAHECGHGAFSKYDWVSDAIGFVLHSSMLVPYFSWQRSHAVHHSRTNHVTEGESHVPMKGDTSAARMQDKLHAMIGEDAFTLWQLFTHLAIGWPLYIMTGVTGGPVRGFSNHFVPSNEALFPGPWKNKVLISSVGCIATLGALGRWAQLSGFAQVMAVYIGPYLVVNAWLVLYTWLQHTDVDIPHYGDESWSWLRGALATVDRPYPFIIDHLHHHIGTTHVLHHLCSKIPHYNAVKASDVLRAKYPELCLYDETPIWKALYRVAQHCVYVEPVEHHHDTWMYCKPPGSNQSTKSSAKPQQTVDG